MWSLYSIVDLLRATSTISPPPSPIPKKNVRGYNEEGVVLTWGRGREGDLLFEKSAATSKSNGSNQCCGSMKFWYRSGSADLYLSQTNGSGSGSCYFRQWPSSRQHFFCLLPYILKVHLHHFSEIKSHKKSQNSKNQCFSYYFSFIRIRIRIRIRISD